MHSSPRKSVPRRATRFRIVESDGSWEFEMLKDGRWSHAITARNPQELTVYMQLLSLIGLYFEGYTS